ncbi:hypothetical protein [Chryseobacterium balustinum]|uniref:Lipoprotein n=1 Tax=Chryseobacterium balustinum TaxID=246 RepID=A0AAX2IQ50_9FLAO|nr:hypothetical protein [Chryseobacterium balustinum]AZB30075.1 hypothetical protein EB354_12900 [Chryseobacterium balustinum]SKB66328.1 hypothetical protein SAMN05421800_105158 [Chryseobacterium balustinum]SQA91779.1 Uncharacterised protein [Chryseobacterium balustinum]
MKSVWVMVLSYLLFVVGLSCSNSVLGKSDIKTDKLIMMQDNSVGFSEERRLNKDIDLKEFVILTTFNQTLDIYSKLNDKKFSRSEPIPTLFDDEFFMLLKPRLKIFKYGDIDVVKIEKEKSVLNVYYTEIENEEYLLNKQKDPILILRLKGGVPSNVNLIPLNIKLK